MAHATIKLTQIDGKKSVVKFELTDEEKEEGFDNFIIQNLYVNRKQAKKLLGVKDLEKVKGIEVTIRAIESKSKSSKSDD